MERRKERVVLCDIDDCMCDSSAIGKHAPADPADLEGWRECYKYFDECVPNKPFIDYIKKLGKHFKIIFITCREDYGDNREKTLQQLKDFTNNEIEIGGLLMRKEGDVRTDGEVKEDLLLEEVLGKYNVVVAFDDKEENCLMYRKHRVNERLYKIKEDKFY